MYGVTGGVTQASHVSVLLSSSLDTCYLVTRAVLLSAAYSNYCCITQCVSPELRHDHAVHDWGQDGPLEADPQHYAQHAQAYCHLTGEDQW